jgi:hypothetical protein
MYSNFWIKKAHGSWITMISRGVVLQKDERPWNPSGIQFLQMAVVQNHHVRAKIPCQKWIVLKFDVCKPNVPGSTYLPSKRRYSAEHPHKQILL